ncbi:hypothetical protein [Burkholderia gladioli]|uniref:hypothetical protein n=1 Tax=Burkholderia gladioli TaxID=28095 RepID=UPI0034DB7C11
MRSRKSTHADSEGASAGKAPPIIEDLTIKGLTEGCAGRTASGTGHEPGEDGACDTAAHRADRPAERSNDGASFRA